MTIHAEELAHSVAAVHHPAAPPLPPPMQDMKDNVTRFVVLSRDPLVATDALASSVPYKTSIVFSLQEVRGWAARFLL